MEHHFEPLISLIVFKNLSIFIIIVFGTITVVALSYMFINIIRHSEKIKAIHELNKYYSDLTIKAACKFYVETKSQNHPPNYEDEPGFDSGNVFRENLIDFFIKRAFKMEKKIDRFYLVLADSGMGKTTFIINLYINYMTSGDLKKRYKMKLFVFGGNDILEELKKIKEDEAKQTILLLDAFDEDMKFALQSHYCESPDEQKCFEERLNELAHTMKNFHKVIITSRTQYFPGQEDRPYEMRFSHYDQTGFYTLEKIYLSPFDDNEIDEYLNKKYGVLRFWNIRKKKIAKNIIKSSPRLMVRPMLLSYIDLLITGNLIFNNVYEIYETLVEKWLEREAKKRRINEVQREKFKKNLYEYSKLIAVEIYKNRIKTNSLSLTKEEAFYIASNNNIDLSNYEITGQSLLTRDAVGNWKFAHKSIYDFMIAKEIIEDIGFLANGFLKAMPMTERFLVEKDWNFTYVREGTFLMGSPETEIARRLDEKQHPVKVSSIFISRYLVTIEQFEEFMVEENYEKIKDENWNSYVSTISQHDKKYPVIYVTWNAAKEYCKWLSKKLNVKVRLPTEAEWEYACRSGTSTPFNTGKNLTTDQANYNGNYPYGHTPKGKFIGKPTLVGSYAPNASGLYDMHGNVWEWCEDLYGKDYYYECEQYGMVTNPTGPTAGSFRVIRGGSWNYGAGYCRSSYRNRYAQNMYSNFVGFRVVCIP